MLRASIPAAIIAIARTTVPENAEIAEAAETVEGAADAVELHREPRRRRIRRVDRPVRQRLGELIRRPCERAADEQLAPAERAPRRGRRAREARAGGAADAEADQKHREDEREGVDRRAEMEREQPRPDHFGR